MNTEHLTPRREPAPVAPLLRRPARRRARDRGRAALVWFVAAVVGLHAAALFLLDEAGPGWRDTEYACRVTRLRDRAAENPGRPTVVVVGSSRVVAAVNPADWEAARPAGPLLFNFGQVGAGPILELMTVRRLFAEGLRPDAVLIEYWPPFLHSEGEWAEARRIPPDRLYPVDRHAVRSHFPQPSETLGKMDWYRWNPIDGSRHRLMALLLPRWLTDDRRIDRAWAGVDAWGWKPGVGTNDRRAALVAQCADTYRPLFANFRISLQADLALREAITTVRQHGVAVGLLYLPESSEFRTLYPPRAEEAVGAHLAALKRELGVPVIDGRTAADDGLIADGIHLSPAGAGRFTRWLAGTQLGPWLDGSGVGRGKIASGGSNGAD